MLPKSFIDTAADGVGISLFATLFAQMSGPPGLTWEDVRQQWVFGLVTALGAALATTIDFPARSPLRKFRWRIAEAVMRVVVGGIVGLLFAAAVISKLGVSDAKASQLFVCGILGVLSWYLLRGVVSLGQWLRDSDWIRRRAQSYLDKPESGRGGADRSGLPQPPAGPTPPVGPTLPDGK